MKAQLIKQNWSVLAQCPNCYDVRSFEMRYMPTAVAGVYVYKEKNYSRLLSVFSQCARCSHGGLAIILDDGDTATAVLESFSPLSIDSVPVPKAVPEDRRIRFQAAEQCAALRAHRADSALVLSVLPD